MCSLRVDIELARGCHHCGMCSSGCDVNRLDPSFRPHRMIHAIGTGVFGHLLKDDAIWKCTTCFTCSERCPQGIPVTDILWSVRARAAAEGRGQQMFAAQTEGLLKTGRWFAASASDHKRRESAGLPPLREDRLIARIFAVAHEGE